MILTKYGSIEGEGHSHSQGHDPNLNRLLPMTHIYAHAQIERNMSISFGVVLFTLFIRGSDGEVNGRKTEKVLQVAPPVSCVI